MYNNYNLKGKLFIVTGASSGIGREVAVQISRSGGKLIITGRNKQSLNETLALLHNSKAHLAESLDLSDGSKITSWVSEVLKRTEQKIDGFVHCAGILNVKPLFFIKEEEFIEIMNINYYSGIKLLQEIAKPSRSNKHSSFVFISSVAGLISDYGLLHYSASKAALISAVKTAALELASYQYRVNSIAPGMIETPMFNLHKHILGEEALNNIIKKIPLGLGKPTDVASAVLFLLSDDSRWITGTTFIVDGGYSCGK